MAAGRQDPSGAQLTGSIHRYQEFGTCAVGEWRCTVWSGLAQTAWLRCLRRGALKMIYFQQSFCF